MNKITALTALALTVTACTTPTTVLQHPDTGQTARCGGSATGSLMGGVVGYHIEKSNAQDCVVDHIEMGFERVKTSKPAESTYSDEQETKYPSAGRRGR